MNSINIKAEIENWFNIRGYSFKQLKEYEKRYVYSVKKEGKDQLIIVNKKITDIDRYLKSMVK